MKIVYNDCFGGFGLSLIAAQRYEEITGRKFYEREVSRTDPALVRVIEELGRAANNRYAQLQFRELPSGTLYWIAECMGYESVKTADDIELRVAE